ncbi:MAG: tetratricopeptide repeat protein [Gammaproteobacteria bacterium]|nr:tetratricopeptide repeat protein [Gammaproteobacteria bacterium]
MSLLMDALKQAERVKEDKPAEPVAEAPERIPASEDAVDNGHAQGLTLALEDSPLVAETVPPSTPETAREEEAPEIPFAEAETRPVATESVPEEPSTTQSPPVITATSGAQAAARLLGTRISQQAAQRRRTWMGITGLTVALTLAIGSYYYYAALAQPQGYIRLPQSISVAGVLDGQTDANTTPQLADESSSASHLAPAAPVQESSGLPAAVPEDIGQVDQRLPEDVSEPFGERLDHATGQTAATPMPRQEAVIRIERGRRPDRVNTLLLSAYEHFQAERWTQAEQAYGAVLAGDPGNRDARLGLAALAERTGDRNTAIDQYRELLRINPRDATAFAVLAALEQVQGGNSESELKLRLAEQPNSAHLHFALANLYATQRRWPQAQQAYFEAQRLAPDNADYAFNLAVSLEHLGRPGLAVEYYRRALQLARSQTVQFDHATAQGRVASLSVMPQP